MHVHYNFYARSQGNQQYTRMASTKRLWRMSEAVSEKANELSENIDLSSPEGEVYVSHAIVMLRMRAKMRGTI